MPNLAGRDLVRLALLAVAVGWLFLDAPAATGRELQFVLELLLLTILTRTLTWRSAAFSVSLGIGVAAPAMILLGIALSRAGGNVSEGIGTWGLVPLLEEAVKLLPVFAIAALHRRRTGDSLNPSDWLLVGCAAGAGFAMLENAELVKNSPGVLRDMAQQYGPHIGTFYLVPGAWGAAGYVGHAAATGLAAASIGLALAVNRQRKAGTSSPVRIIRMLPGPWWTLAAVGFAWVTVEHMLANYYVNTGSDFGLMLGNGALTPWILLVMTAFIVGTDVAHGRQALARSAIFRRRMQLIREVWRGAHVPVRRTRAQIAMIVLGELRMLNAAAWATFDRRPS